MKKFYLLIVSIVFCIACEAVFVEDISDEEVVLIAPSDNVTLDEGDINFYWEAVTEASRYRLRIVTPSFVQANQVLLDTIITQTNFSHKLVEGVYEWGVRALNSDYETEETRAVFSLTSTDFSQQSPVIVSPIENLISNVSNQTIRWESVEGAEEYRLQVWNPDENGTKEKDILLTSLNHSHAFSSGNYLIKVRGQNDQINSLYEQVSILVDLVKPNKPENVAPNAAASQNETTVNFTWTRTNVQGSVEVDSLYVFKDINLSNLLFKVESSTKSHTRDDIEVGTYYWYVKSFDKATNESERSDETSFTIN